MKYHGYRFHYSTSPDGFGPFLTHEQAGRVNEVWQTLVNAHIRERFPGADIITSTSDRPVQAYDPDGNVADDIQEAIEGIMEHVTDEHTATLETAAWG